MWKRLSALGDVDHGFVAGSDETWAFSRRGPYSALAVAASSVRPGVVLDRLDEALAMAGRGQGRTAEPSASAGEWAAEPKSDQPDTQRWLRYRRHAGGKPRRTAELAADTSPPAEAPADDEDQPATATEPALEAPIEDEAQAVEAHDEEEEERSPAEPDEPTVSWDVDPISLAREFAGLIPDAEKEK